jgi:rubrerythrin
VQQTLKPRKWTERLRLLTRKELYALKARAGTISLTKLQSPEYHCLICGMFFYDRNSIKVEELLCPICLQAHFEEMEYEVQQV